MTSILIVDDHAVVRKGLKQALCENIRDAVFAESGSFQSALVVVARRAWDIVILDLSLPGRGGFELLEEMRRCRPDVKVLVLDVYSDRRYAARSMELGARGYVSKDASLVALLNAVRSVIAGNNYFPGVGQIASAPDGVGKDFRRKLSRRERSVLLAISDGEGTGEIAEKLGLSTKTVSTYKTRVLNKLQLHSTADLVRHVLTESRRG